jgi:hypothetical protein
MKLLPASFDNSSRKITAPVHRAPHYKFSGENFVKKDVLSKRTAYEKISPLAQPNMRKASRRTEKGVSANEANSSLDSFDIAIRQFQTVFAGIPFELSLQISDENIRPAEVHEFRTAGARSLVREYLGSRLKRGEALACQQIRATRLQVRDQYRRFSFAARAPNAEHRSPNCWHQHRPRLEPVPAKNLLRL